MNPIIQAILAQVIGLVEIGIQSEGPSVISWCETELAKLKSKCGTATLRRLNNRHMTTRTEKIYAALDQLCDALDLGRSESSTQRLLFVLATAFGETKADEMESICTPRTDAEIGDAIEKLIDQVWYNRCHVPMFENINNGTETCDPEIWKGALEAAEELRAKYDVEGGELGPFTDFEWGMINGKLSALRWVDGDEWDSLDT